MRCSLLIPWMPTVNGSFKAVVFAHCSSSAIVTSLQGVILIVTGTRASQNRPTLLGKDGQERHLAVCLAYRFVRAPECSHALQLFMATDLVTARTSRQIQTRRGEPSTAFRARIPTEKAHGLYMDCMCSASFCVPEIGRDCSAELQNVLAL